MSKLKLFQIIGESMAKSHGTHPWRKDVFIDFFFKGVAAKLYPKNLHRREWALSNMEMFYKQESERLLIMNRLTGQTTGTDILDMIRQRKR